MIAPFELEITDLARGGKGLGRDASGRVVFVPFSAPGDRLRVRLVHQDKRYAEAQIEEILSPSPLRVTPPCPAFERCGGCTWQHLPYELQWKTKVKGALNALKRAQIENTPAPTEFPAEQVWGYRNRIQLRGFAGELGFYASGTHDLVALDRCEIARQEINHVWADLRREGAQMARPYKLEVEVLPNGQIQKNWNSRHAAGGFRQVHDAQNLKLQSWIRSVLSPGLVIYDLFGGAGNLSLNLAPEMREIHCVDVGVPGSIARETAKNYHFYRESVVSWLKKASPLGGAAAAIFDPPREGLREEFGAIFAEIERLGITQAALVGCDPDSWARDLGNFVKRGWKIRNLGVLDLFPQTAHVESLAFIERVL